MKQSMTVAGLVVILVLVLAVRALAAPTLEPLVPQEGVPTALAVTATPQAQSAPETSASPAWGMGMGGGMRGRMMGGQGRMQGRMGMRAGMTVGSQMSSGPGMMQDHTGWNASGETGMLHEAMMAGATSMHDDAAALLGMTTQDLYNHMESGKSLAQIAAEKGITEQQLTDGIMASRKAAFDQAVMGGYMTQAQADSMLEQMQNNMKTMVNDPSLWSNGLGGMWDDSQSAPWGMHR